MTIKVRQDKLNTIYLQDTSSSCSSVQDTESDDDIAAQINFASRKNQTHSHDEPNIHTDSDHSSDKCSETSDIPSDTSFEAFPNWEQEEVSILLHL